MNHGSMERLIFVNRGKKFRDVHCFKIDFSKIYRKLSPTGLYNASSGTNIVNNSKKYHQLVVNKNTF